MTGRAVVVVALVGLVSSLPVTAQGVPSAQTTEQGVRTEPAKQSEACEAYRQALSALVGGNLATARKCLERATSLLPRWSEARNLLAFVLLQVGDPKAARTHYEEVLRYDPANFLARSSLAGFAADATLTGPASTVQAATQELRKPTDQFPRTSREEQLAQYEQLLVQLINRERTAQGLKALSVDTDLTQQAREQAVDMRDLGYFDHVSPSPGRKTVLDRFLQHHPQQPPLIAENISRRWGTASSLSVPNIENSHQGLMQSAGHRHNILHPGVTHVGVGLVANSRGDYWICEVFACLNP